MRFAILGGGMQGRIIAANLAARADVREVNVLDVRAPDAPLPPKTRFVEADALDRDAVHAGIGDADAVVVALPSIIGKPGLANAIGAGKPIVDISFTPDTLADLSDDARRHDTTVVADCGVAPGLSHLLAGLAYHELGGLDRLAIRVGGIPLDPPPYFHHAVYFNASDLISEYYRPARLRKEGKGFQPHPLDEPVERYHDPEMGEHEAFPSDGLRSLLTTYPDVPDMIELTLRRPGHLDAMRSLRAMGFFDTHALEPGTEPPETMSARVLAHRYPESKHPDYLLMVVEAEKGGERRAWRLLDRHHEGVSAMSRTTGFTAAAVAIQLAQRRFVEPGLHPPEWLAREDGLVERIVEDLRERGVRVERVGQD